MALILMAVQDTRENNRTWCTKETLWSLRETVNWDRHRLIIIDNNSCDTTAAFLVRYTYYELITLPKNIGQARALNKGLLMREPGELVVRMDNDVVIHQANWIEDMEYVLEKDPRIGVVSLKRKNAWEHPTHSDPAFRSRLEMLPHKSGQRWMVVEVADSVLGTCQALRPEFLDKIGFFYQMGGLWGFIDPIVCAKAHVLGYKTVFLPHIHIDYLDEDLDSSKEKSPYQLWKEQQATKSFPAFEREKERILSGKSMYHGPDDK
jgi:GT2 family glycosyltransferase